MYLFGGSGTEWYAVHAKPRLETKVLTFLPYAGIPTFLPRLLVHRRLGSEDSKIVYVRGGWYGLE